ncbi:MAG: hypothetical protein JWO91_1900 [Acidobacteriaceae bacterium]|nr:hypothetical protein [Acidobacteriaceae bacterium]
MSSPSLSSPEPTAWKALYKAALFEMDCAKRPDRIAKAEKALVIRARELFKANGDDREEKEALDDAMFALHAFGNVWRRKSRSQFRTPEDVEGPKSHKVKFVSGTMFDVP